MLFAPDLAAALGADATRRLTAKARMWTRLWGAPALLQEVTVKTNPRLRTAVARFRRDGCTIEVGPRFLVLREHRVEILAHELAHAGVDSLYGPVRPIHGEPWRQLVRVAGFTPCTRLLVDSPLATAKRGRLSRSIVEHHCPVCHMVRYSSRTVRRWRCARCVGDGLCGDLVVSRRERS